MAELTYTHAVWRVKEDEIEQFVEAWSALSEKFKALARPPLWGTLIQNLAEPTLFYSFGPWAALADVEAMRSDPAAREAIARVQSHCIEAKPGTYRAVKHVDVGGSRARTSG